MSPRLKASFPIRAASTFSCDIARAVSRRLGVCARRRQQSEAAVAAYTPLEWPLARRSSHSARRVPSGRGYDKTREAQSVPSLWGGRRSPAQ